jgi:uncharacterized membrane protein YozB (DUF420 family)
VIGLASAFVVVIVAVLLLGRQLKTGAVHLVSALPAVNAALNGTSAALLTAGYCFIRQRKVTAGGRLRRQRLQEPRDRV